MRFTSSKKKAVVFTVAQCAVVLLTFPGVEASEKLLVSSFANNRINRFSAVTSESLSPYTAGATLVNPLGMTIGPDGDLYIASEGNDRILRVNLDTGSLIEHFVFDDPATSGVDETGGLDNPASVVFGPDGHLYVSSFETDAILKYDGSTGAFLSVFVPSGSGGLNGPDAGMVFGPSGDLYVPSFWNHRVLRYNGSTGALVDDFVPSGSGGLVNPRTLLFRPSDGHLLVCSEGSDQVLLYDGTSGASLGTFINGVDQPTGMAYGEDGNLYVASLGTNSIRRYTPDAGLFIDVFATGLSLPTFALMMRDGVPDFSESEEFGAADTLTLAWGDADGDGAFDLAAGNATGSGSLFQNDGSGGFASQAEFGSGSTFALVWGDYDNDGDSDVAVGRTGANSLYVNDSLGAFTAEAQFGADSTVSMAWGDCDNDGDIDLAVGNGILGPEVQNQLFINNGDGSFSGQSAFGMGRTVSLVWADVDGDGDADVAVGNGGFQAAGQNYLYLNDGSCGFAQVEEFGLGDTTAMAWGDLNNDGILDLVVSNWGSDNQNRLYLGNGDGTFLGQNAFAARDTNSIALGDVDNDGDLDVVVGNGDFGSADQNFLYLNDGQAIFAEIAAFGLGSTNALAWADVDGDGDLDLALGNEHTPATDYFYRNNENDQDYLILHLEGHAHDLDNGYSNRDAIGAEIAVYESGHICDPAYLLGYRQVSAKGGFSSQQSIDAEFGISNHLVVDVRIDWPGSGGAAIVQELIGVAVGQRLVIHESANTPPVDCNGNDLSDACELGSGAQTDCNGNDVLDSCDIIALTSEDCTGNGVPDECEPDCNSTLVADSCDILLGTSQDCTANGIPDECEPDCNSTLTADSCDILLGTSEDCSSNGIPDECEPDCNGNVAADSCDILGGTSQDCNANEIPDTCDIDSGASTDVNLNGVPDECDLCPSTTAPTQNSFAKNRFLTIEAGSPGRQIAIRVKFISLPVPYDVLDGTEMWVDAPFDASENGGSVDPVSGFPNFKAATLNCDPVYADWSVQGTVHVFHAGIVPLGLYDIQVVDEACPLSSEEVFSDPLSLTMTKWADVCGPYDSGAGQWSGPDNVVGVPSDIVSMLDKFSGRTGAPIKTRADIEPATPNLVVNIGDISRGLDAFRGLAYPFAPPAMPCP